ncbi:TetR/AcrR family transcriptional regulator [Fictibacillus sp. NRS-1165]|uniref:TetR/AcrR family transcriptional regulator n=1 Tax=Fictibacillus sp. NRS-1165 TaxID=3144463 RepID=UPI003D1DEB46
MFKGSLLEAMVAHASENKKQTDKQQKILESAIRIFAEKGYTNTSTSEIAKAAGVAEGTIFRKYGTKDNLLLSVIVPFLKDLFPAIAEGVFNEVMTKDILSFEDFLRAFLKNRIDFFNENKEIFQIVVKEMLYNTELRNEMLPFFLENVSPRIAKIINVFKERGELADFPTRTIQKMVFTFIGGYFVSNFVLLPENGTDSEDKEIENIIRFVMNGVGTGKKPH